MADLTSDQYAKMFATAPKVPKLKPKDSTPTRQVSGTSYKAQGADQVKPPSLEEIGSAIATIWPDPIPDVGTPVQASRTYLKMARDDASVRVSLRAGKAPVLGADYFIEAFDDEPINVAIAEFVDFNLFHGMTVPWNKVLEQILTMYEYGKSIFEPVWELREWAPKKTSSGANRKQYTMLQKLAQRSALTIGTVNYDDNGGPLSVDHTAVDAKGNSKQVTIPIEKLVIFTFDQQGGGIEGMSVLRSAYKHWWYKDRLYNIDAIQKERHGIGVPDIEIQAGASPQDIALSHTLGQNLRTNEFAYIVRPVTIKVGFAKIEGQPVNVLDSIEHHDEMIMKNLMVQFLNMGTGSSGSGSRAAGATAMDMFLKSMRHVADSVCDAINHYLIPNLVAYNFPTDQFPQLKVRNVGEVKDLQMWSAAMRNLIQAEAIQVDDDTEQWIRQQMDMPTRTTEWLPPSQRPATVTEQIAEQGDDSTAATNGNGNGNGKVSKVGQSDRSNNGGAGNVGKSESSAE